MEQSMEQQYPTKIATVNGRVLHPSTGKPVNCELMAPFEERVQDLRNPFLAWSWEAATAVGG